MGDVRIEATAYRTRKDSGALYEVWAIEFHPADARLVVEEEPLPPQGRGSTTTHRGRWYLGRGSVTFPAERRDEVIDEMLASGAWHLPDERIET